MSEFTPAQTQMISEIRGRLRITKVVATRALKLKGGDFFVGMSATIQEDAGGQGTDLISALTDHDIANAAASHGMSVVEARVAALMLGREVDLEVHRHALGGGALSKTTFDRFCADIRNNYNLLLQEVTPKDRKDSK
jgi:hypothetical protein